MGQLTTPIPSLPVSSNSSSDPSESPTAEPTLARRRMLMDTATSSQIEVFMNRFTVTVEREPGTTEDNAHEEGTTDDKTSDVEKADEEAISEVKVDLWMVIIAFGAFVACCLCGVVVLAITRRQLYSKVNQMKGDITTSNAVEMRHVADTSHSFK